MKVHELIAQLEQLNTNAEVCALSETQDYEPTIAIYSVADDLETFYLVGESK